MNTTKSPVTKSAPSDGLAGRKFGKAKTIAERLGVCPRTIFRWADDGKIARHKINARVVLFDEAEVIAFIEAARVSTDWPELRESAVEKRDRRGTDVFSGKVKNLATR